MTVNTTHAEADIPESKRKDKIKKAFWVKNIPSELTAPVIKPNITNGFRLPNLSDNIPRGRRKNNWDNPYEPPMTPIMVKLISKSTRYGVIVGT